MGAFPREKIGTETSRKEKGTRKRDRLGPFISLPEHPHTGAKRNEKIFVCLFVFFLQIAAGDHARKMVSCLGQGKKKKGYVAKECCLRGGRESTDSMLLAKDYNDPRFGNKKLESRKGKGSKRARKNGHASISKKQKK